MQLHIHTKDEFAGIAICSFIRFGRSFGRLNSFNGHENGYPFCDG
ncbi:hypothetical protein [Saccharococcus caldoxylosilyticus]|nr:hypothetical protein [Parageobacillus caldoxylosilyticus]